MPKRSVILPASAKEMPIGDALKLTVAELLKLKPLNDTKTGRIQTRGSGAVVVFDDRIDIAVPNADGTYGTTYTVSVNVARTALTDDEKAMAEKTAAERQAAKDAREQADIEERQRAISSAVTMTRDAYESATRTLMAKNDPNAVLKGAIEGAKLLRELQGTLGG